MNTFDITKEDVLNLAAIKVADQFADMIELEEKVNRIVNERIEKIITSNVNSLVEEVLKTEMEQLLSKEIVPVDIWGDKCGTPTTIRAELHKRAAEFWSVRVNDRGERSDYGGTPRHEHLMKKLLAEEFGKAVKENAETIVAAFKTALKVDATKLVNEHIERLIK